ncbi:ATP-grasp fold amidoligase family protein [Vagococcus carniphilus]|uniref:ATP-grasp fold amidoligase family protein n=1 Tax=Vagococcus carniphilus TaxID=218144 RepID=UPI00288E5426|nr:ATP-grasp fold amidoligase family protein [Vagococcus carniphilus]MDT2865744.1 ATP-grasp fold amidoligase family protein [Vagococcus carniphilus]
MNNKILKALREPYYTCMYALYLGNFNKMSDKKYLEMEFKHRMKKVLDLENPITFNEKLQWLKLYDRNPQYTSLVDKYEVRKFVEEKIGEEYLIPLLGVWTDFSDINFEKLPNKFVLKTTHDSGGVVICQNKQELDIDKAKEKINKSLKNNYFYAGREWPYKNVKPKIICEELLETDNGELPNDYKFSCFNGSVDNVMVAIERNTGKPKFYFFDNEWQLLRYNVSGLNASSDFTLPRPKNIKKMFDVASILSEKFPYVRVDLYYEKDKIYFGELTFYPQSGFDSNLLPETDLLFGSMINL